MAPAVPLVPVHEYFKTRALESPSPRHEFAVDHLFRALNAHVSERGLGEIWLAPLDVVLDERFGVVVQPDLFFVSDERLHIVRDRVRGAPDLVIEVLSSDSCIADVEQRVAWFAKYGVRECWLLHQDDRSVTVIRFADRRGTTRDVYPRRRRIVSAVLPDFSASIDEIFSDSIDRPYR